MAEQLQTSIILVTFFLYDVPLLLASTRHGGGSRSAPLSPSRWGPARIRPRAGYTSASSCRRLAARRGMRWVFPKTKANPSRELSSRNVVTEGFTTRKVGMTVPALTATRDAHKVWTTKKPNKFNQKPKETTLTVLQTAPGPPQPRSECHRTYLWQCFTDFCFYFYFQHMEITTVQALIICQIQAEGIVKVYDRASKINILTPFHQ